MRERILRALFYLSVCLVVCAVVVLLGAGLYIRFKYTAFPR